MGIYICFFGEPPLSAVSVIEFHFGSKSIQNCFGFFLRIPWVDVDWVFVYISLLLPTSIEHLCAIILYAKEKEIKMPALIFQGFVALGIAYRS